MGENQRTQVFRYQGIRMDLTKSTGRLRGLAAAATGSYSIFWRRRSASEGAKHGNVLLKLLPAKTPQR